MYRLFKGRHAGNKQHGRELSRAFRAEVGHSERLNELPERHFEEVVIILLRHLLPQTPLSQLAATRALPPADPAQQSIGTTAT